VLWTWNTVSSNRQRHILHHHYHHHHLGIELLICHQGFWAAGRRTSLGWNERCGIIKGIRAFVSLAHPEDNEHDEKDDERQCEETTNDRCCNNDTTVYHVLCSTPSSSDVGYCRSINARPTLPLYSPNCIIRFVPVRVHFVPVRFRVFIVVCFSLFFLYLCTSLIIIILDLIKTSVNHWWIIICEDQWVADTSWYAGALPAAILRTWGPAQNMLACIPWR